MFKFKIPGALFSPRRYVQTEERVTAPGRRTLGPVQWVVGRDLCLYRLMSLADIPSPERSSALSLQISRWSPFAEPGSYTITVGDFAQVWIWDRVVQQQAMEEAGVFTTVIFPETLLHPQVVEEETCCLVACSRGVEGRIWQDGILRASRWWSAAPDVSQFETFLAGNDYPGDTPLLPGVQNVSPAPYPWGSSSRNLAPLLQRYQGKLVAVLFLTLCFFLTYALADLYTWRLYQQQLEQQVDTLKKEIEPILKARSMAIADRAALQNLVDLMPYPSMLELWAVMLELKVGGNTRLGSWHYTSGRLDLTLTGDNMDPSFNVKAFLAHPFFSDVTMEKGRNPKELKISMRVNPWQ